MSYLCGSDPLHLAPRNVQSSRDLTPAIAAHLCPTGNVGLQGTCTVKPAPFDLPKALQTTSNRISISSGRLGPILADQYVPRYTVSIFHALSDEFDYLQAVRLEDYDFRIVNWSALSLDPDCCHICNTNTMDLYGKAVSSKDLESLIGLLFKLNAAMGGKPLIISFRSKQGIVYDAELTQ